MIPEGRTYSPPEESGGGIPPYDQARALSEGNAASAEAYGRCCVLCGSRHHRPSDGELASKQFTIWFHKTATGRFMKNGIRLSCFHNGERYLTTIVIHHFQ